MDVPQMITELRTQREQLDAAIIVLERLALNGKKRRGRPPKSLAEPGGEPIVKKRRGRPPGSKNRPK